MPTRNMIAANKAIFASLDDYYSSCDEPLSNAGSPRWIRTIPSERRFLKQAVLASLLSFGPIIKLARFEFENQSVFFSSGLEIPEPPAPLRAVELDGGFLTTFLSEVRLAPIATPSQIRDVVEVADKTSTPNYDGHDPKLISSLYSGLQAFCMDDLAEEESFKLFFLICLCDRRHARWLDDRLLSGLKSIAGLNSSAIPYRTLCRSILDVDPSSVYLSLYRCLEALYAYSHTNQLKAALGVSAPWVEVARTLEDTLGWYPREEPSLESLLGHAQTGTLELVATALSETIPQNSSPARFVARRIYQLRNDVVHFRPLQQKAPVDKLDWNRVCEAMAALVFDVYGKTGQGLAVLL